MDIHESQTLVIQGGEHDINAACDAFDISMPSEPTVQAYIESIRSSCARLQSIEINCFHIMLSEIQDE